jgi:hypothetical protein
MEPPIHQPHADDLRELCALVAALRAWSHTQSDIEDAGRLHKLYPPRQYRPGVGANEGPLWAAVETVLQRHGYGRGPA